MTNSELTGVWVAIPTPWTSSGTVDKDTVCELVSRYKASGLDGAYTTGTDGEMHVLELGEFRDLVAAFSQAATDEGLPVQIGCSWPHTNGVLERMAIAREHGIDTVQIALPSWIPLSDAEVLRFFESIYDSFPETRLIHYNIERSGRFLSGADYRAILDVAPTLSGSKHTGGNVGSLIEIVQATPDLAHFVVDRQIVPGALFGARGFYSFIANLSPDFARALWYLSDTGQWDRAARLCETTDAFFRTWLAATGDVTASPALAKIATAAGVSSQIPLTVKSPYIAGTTEHVARLKQLVETDFPVIGQSFEELTMNTRQEQM